MPVELLIAMDSGSDEKSTPEFSIPYSILLTLGRVAEPATPEFFIPYPLFLLLFDAIPEDSAVMGNIIDNFPGSSGAPLDPSKWDVESGTWSQVGDGTIQATFGGSDGYTISTWTPGGTDYDVSITLNQSSPASTCVIQALAHYTSDGDFIAMQIQTNIVILLKKIAGGNNTLDTFNISPVTAGPFTLRCRGDQFSVILGGTLTAGQVSGGTTVLGPITITDSSVSVAGKAGIKGFLDLETSGARPATFTAGDYIPSPDLTAGTVNGFATGPTSAKFTASDATGGTGPYSYQLYSSDTSGTLGAPISGATNLVNDVTVAANAITYLTMRYTDDTTAHVDSTQFAFDNTGVMAMTDSHIVYPPDLWDPFGTTNLNPPFTGASAVQATVQGAYFKFGMNVPSGKTGSIKVILDPALNSGVPDDHFPSIWATVDDAVPSYQRPSAANPVATLATGLSEGFHAVVIRIYVLGVGGDYWTDPVTGARIACIDLGSGCSSADPDSLPATIKGIVSPRPKRLLGYGDSIFDGTGLDYASSPVPVTQSRTLEVLAQALDAEYGGTWLGTTGFAADGTIGPALTTVWNQLGGSGGTGHIRPFTNIDYILISHGTNDFRGGKTQLTAAIVKTQLENFRSSCGSNTFIGVNIPPGNSFDDGSHDPTIQSTVKTLLLAGIAAYQAAHPSDDRVFVIDVTDRFYPFMASFSLGGNYLSADGIHPNQSGHALYGACIASAYQAAVDAITGGSPPAGTTYTVLGIPSAPTVGESYPVVVVLDNPASASGVVTFGTHVGITWGGTVSIGTGGVSGSTTVTFTAAGSYTPTCTHTGLGFAGNPTLPGVTATSGGGSSPTAVEIADAILTRDWTEIVPSVPDRCTLQALRFLRNTWSAPGNTLTVKAEDDTTTAWTKPVTTDAAALPITGTGVG